MSGHLWGYSGDVKYMPIDVRYSYLISPHDSWTLRYAPELTALAMLDWPVPGAVPTKNQPYTQYLRTRAYGSGFSPVGFETDFLPAKRIQPFLSTNGGFVYYDQRVLSPQGSQWMYTIDFGCGLHIFRKARQDWSLWLPVPASLECEYQRAQPGNRRESCLCCGVALPQQRVSLKRAPAKTRCALPG